MISLFYINVIVLIMFVDYYEIFIVHYWSFNLKANFVTSVKKIKQQNFQTIWTKVDLIINLGHKIRKSK